MRAKEFIIESEKSVLIHKTIAQSEKENKKTQPATPYKAKHYKSGKYGVPTGVDPHDVHNQTQGSDEYGSLRGKIPLEAQAAMPGAFSIEDLPSDFYGMYRLGLGLAGGDRNIATADNFGRHPFVMPFSPEEHVRFEKEIKRQGHKTRLRTTKDSLELSTNNTVSPVAKRKPNKYGV